MYGHVLSNRRWMLYLFQVQQSSIVPTQVNIIISGTHGKDIAFIFYSKVHDHTSVALSNSSQGIADLLNSSNITNF